ncbi:MAG: hypothetical protein LBU38_04845 [Propionibacteriaceae bacterium]|jgi:hypothetical protein|nr:hypothetical protein [Propionibacteriaceae bacterium]
MLKSDHFPTADGEGKASGSFLPSVKEFFDDVFRETRLQRSDVIRKAGISRTYGYQIMDGTRRGKRDYYIAIAFAMELDLRTTQRLLAVTECGSLHPLVKRDAALIHAIHNKYDLLRLYTFLLELELLPLDTGTESA